MPAATPLQLTARERDTIAAALRFWLARDCPERDDAKFRIALDDIAFGERLGAAGALDAGEIELLIARL